MLHANWQDTVAKIRLRYKVWLAMPETGHMSWQRYRLHVVDPASLVDYFKKCISNLLPHKTNNPGSVFLYLFEQLGHTSL